MELSGGESAKAVTEAIKTWMYQQAAQTFEQREEENCHLRRELHGAMRRCDIVVLNPVKSGTAN